jgi:hypothetical protein
LREWRQTQEHDQPADPHDVDQRIRTLEETVEREAQALRRMHEEPLKQLQAQAASLTDICAAAANSVNGLDLVESRLAALQADVQHHLTNLTRSLEAFVADLRIGAASGAATHGSAPAWPLDRVVRLHEELRRTDNGQDPDPFAQSGAGDPHSLQPRAVSQAPEPPRSGRRQFLERGMAGEAEQPSAADTRTFQRQSWYLAGALALAAAVVVFALEQRIETKLNDAGTRAAHAEQQATAATQLANQEAAIARAQANKQITEARESAQRAETIGAILTAPDLIRFNLASGTVDRSSAQLLWSRTRGLVLSASRLPTAPPETTYQLWLKTGTEPVSAGLFVPDATGRATLVVDVAPRVLGPVVGAEVTIEPSGGRPAPSGRTLLARLPEG